MREPKLTEVFLSKLLCPYIMPAYCQKCCYPHFDTSNFDFCERMKNCVCVNVYWWFFGATPVGDPSHRLQHASDKPLTSTSVLSSLTSSPSCLHPSSEEWNPKRWCMFLWPRYNADVMAMVVVAVATVALNGLAAAWQRGLVADSCKLLCVRSTGWRCRVSPS